LATKKEQYGSRTGKHDPPRPKDWSAFLKSTSAASPEFMNDVEDLPVQERSFFHYPQTLPAKKTPANAQANETRARLESSGLSIPYSLFPVPCFLTPPPTAWR
jgi:hypothetical protein